MAQEAICVVETELPIQFVCADGTGIEKGAAVELSGDFTVSTGNGAADICGGIAAGEKIVSNGTTFLPTYRGGIFRVYLSGTVTRGDPLTLDSMANHFKTAKTLTSVQVSGAEIWGIALESGTTGQQKLMELRPQAWRGVAT
jgi:hypothetical protein